MGDAAPKVTEPRRVCPLKTRDVIDRILVFTEQFAEVQFYTYQSLFSRRIIESVLDNDGNIITGLWSRQSGKTETVACLCLGMALILPALAREFPDDQRFMPFNKGFWCGVYAPVAEQAYISFGRMRDKTASEYGEAFLEDPELGVGIATSRGDTLAFTNGSYILARTASPDSQIEGKTYHLVVCEEAQKLLRTKVEKEIRPMLAATNGTMVKIGTAWESRGGFHTTIQHNIDTHARGGPRNHFEFPYDIVFAEKRRSYEKTRNPFHLNYEKFVNNEIFRLGGIDSSEFKMNFRCMWQESRVIAVRSDVFLAAADGNIEAGRYPGSFQVAGLDIGKINDATVLTVMNVDYGNPIINKSSLPGADEDKQVYYHKTVLDWLELGGSFEGNTGQYRMLVDYLSETGVQVLVIDATSMGDPVFERIEAMIGGTIECIPFRFTSMSKSELYKYYLQELHARRITYAGGPETKKRFEFGKFQQEHLDLDREDYGGYAVCQAPDGGHDDYTDSAALACWAEKMAQKGAMPEISVSSASAFGGRASGRGGSGDGATVESAGHRGNRYARRW